MATAPLLWAHTHARAPLRGRATTARTTPHASPAIHAPMATRAFPPTPPQASTAHALIPPRLHAALPLIHAPSTPVRTAPLAPPSRWAASRHTNAPALLDTQTRTAPPSLTTATRTPASLARPAPTVSTTTRAPVRLGSQGANATSTPHHAASTHAGRTAHASPCLATPACATAQPNTTAPTASLSSAAPHPAFAATLAHAWHQALRHTGVHVQPASMAPAASITALALSTARTAKTALSASTISTHSIVHASMATRASFVHWLPLMPLLVAPPTPQRLASLRFSSI